MKTVKDKYHVVGADLDTGYEWWHNFYEFHKLAIDELEAFDYEQYKENGFKVNKLGDYPLKLETKPEWYIKTKIVSTECRYGIC